MVWKLQQEYFPQIWIRFSFIKLSFSFKSRIGVDRRKQMKLASLYLSKAQIEFVGFFFVNKEFYRWKNYSLTFPKDIIWNQLRTGTEGQLSTSLALVLQVIGLDKCLNFTVTDLNPPIIFKIKIWSLLTLSDTSHRIFVRRRWFYINQYLVLNCLVYQHNCAF